MPGLLDSAPSPFSILTGVCSPPVQIRPDPYRFRFGLVCAAPFQEGARRLSNRDVVSRQLHTNAGSPRSGFASSWVRIHYPRRSSDSDPMGCKSPPSGRVGLGELGYPESRRSSFATGGRSYSPPSLTRFESRPKSDRTQTRLGSGTNAVGCERQTILS